MPSGRSKQGSTILSGFRLVGVKEHSCRSGSLFPVELADEVPGGIPIGGIGMSKVFLAAFGTAALLSVLCAGCGGLNFIGIPIATCVGEPIFVIELGPGLPDSIGVGAPELLDASVSDSALTVQVGSAHLVEAYLNGARFLVVRLLPPEPRGCFLGSGPPSPGPSDYLADYVVPIEPIEDDSGTLVFDATEGSIDEEGRFELALAPGVTEFEVAVAYSVSGAPANPSEPFENIDSPFSEPRFVEISTLINE